MENLEKIGVLHPKSSREITASPLGVGFECLDRQMWRDTDEVYELAGRLGVKWGRLQSGWNRTETVQGHYDFAWLDRSVNLLLDQGIQPWLCLCYGNQLYTDAPAPDAVGWVPLHTPVARMAWSAYVTATVRHFRDRVTHYEIWNEPNVTHFWRPGPRSPDSYMDLVKLTAPLIRQHDPAAKIVGGAAGGGPSVTNNDFLRECLCRDLAKFVDVYTHHAYSLIPEHISSEWERRSLRRLLDEFGGDDLRLWQGEGGCPSELSATRALCGVPYTEERQAKHALRRLVLDLVNGYDLVSYFQISDFQCYYMDGYEPRPNFFGLLTCDQPVRLKRSYRAMQHLCSLFDGETVLAPDTMTGIHQDAIWSDAVARARFHEQVNVLQQYAFQRRGYPLAVCWNAATLFPELCGKDEFAPLPVELRLWSPERLLLPHPVVIDLLSGEVFKVNQMQTGVYYSPNSSWIMVYGVPLKDYPMAVTDLAAVAELII